MNQRRTGRRPAATIKRVLVFASVAVTARLADAQQPKRAHAGAVGAGALVFDGVTVVDVEHGTLMPEQRVIITGTQIQRVGAVAAVKLPPRAQVIDARGKYLIPGLWDMHVHSTWGGARAALELFYPLFLANGVTGLRDASSNQPLDTLRKWRREILAGTQVGPPRQLFSGPAIDGHDDGCQRVVDSTAFHTCVADPADARHLVDSLVTAGADMIKTYDLSRELYLAIAAEARHLHVPFGGHLHDLTASEASDSGAAIIDHTNTNGGLTADCVGEGTTVEECQPLAERLARNGTWFAPTLIIIFNFVNNAAAAEPPVYAVVRRLKALAHEFLAGAPLPADWLTLSVPDTASVAGNSVSASQNGSEVASQAGFLNLTVAARVGVPIIAGSDVSPNELDVEPPGFSLHAELALLVAEGLSPIEALRAATLNPAKLLKATDSLGTVATGKLADLVLLDANPLVDITNTTTIRAVVANGRYFDRAALDRLLAEAQAKARHGGKP